MKPFFNITVYSFKQTKILIIFMRKTNFLFALIASLFVLGTTSCDTDSDTPTPMVIVDSTGSSTDSVDLFTVTDLEGSWENTFTEYEGVRVPRSEACDSFETQKIFQVTDFRFNTNDMTSVMYAFCVRNSFNNSPFTTNTKAGTFNIAQNISINTTFKIIESDFETVPNTMTLEIVESICNCDSRLREGIKYTLVKV